MALQAINTRDFSKIAPYLHPSFTITTVDNRVFHKVPEFEQYWNQQFSNSIEDIKMELKVDTPRTFLSPETAISYGDAISTFYFKDGNKPTMAMRWTAVLQKFQGDWTIQSLHFSSNLLDNPVLNGAQQAGRAGAVAAGVGGILLGAVAMLLWRRKPKPEMEKVEQIQ
jgi:ketosteroid isomerase-like protein